MIKRLSFKNANTLGEIETRVLDKIDEIAEVVNALTESKKEVTMLKNRISVLETKTTGLANTTITHSKDGITTSVGTKERGSSMKMTSGKIDCKANNPHIEIVVEKWDRTKADISSLKCNR